MLRPWLILVGVRLAAAETFAVVVAGSSGYFNYRHQADVCHAYHILRRSIPEQNVILMTYDDAATSRYNSAFPGQLFNRPTPEGAGGWNVRSGCNATYTGSDVNKVMFLAVLTGDQNKTGGRPVLQSGPADRVFINFVDHGAVGLVSMPVGAPLYAHELLDALRTMRDKQMYKELVFYMEACESGSMFENLLPNDASIFATTAANAEESSFGTYCGADSEVNGVELSTCLGDLYSVNWMEDADLPSHFQSESLEAQFELLVARTDLSHVMRYGDLSFEGEPVHNFMESDNKRKYFSLEPPADATRSPSTSWDSRRVKHLTLQRMLTRTDLSDDMKQELAAELKAEEAHMADADATFAQVAHRALDAATNVRGNGQESSQQLRRRLRSEGWSAQRVVTTRLPLRQETLPCLARVTDAAIAACGRFSDYALKHVRTLANLCELGVREEDVMAAVRASCGLGDVAPPVALEIA